MSQDGVLVHNTSCGEPTERLFEDIFRNGDLRQHLTTVEKFNQSKAVTGGHNLDEFNKAVKQHNINVLNTVKSSNTPGVSHIKYQIPAMEKGQLTSNYKATVFEKTVYDPKIWSDEKVFELSKKAAAQGLINPANNGKYRFSETVEGMKFSIYLNKNNRGIVTNIHPEL